MEFFSNFLEAVKASFNVKQIVMVLIIGLVMGVAAKCIKEILGKYNYPTIPFLICGIFCAYVVSCAIVASGKVELFSFFGIAANLLSTALLVYLIGDAIAHK